MVDQHGDTAPAARTAGAASTAATEDTALAGAPPAPPELDRAMARARAEAALFGHAEAVKVGRYRVIERAGAGGMGVVWSAWDPELHRGVALKLASSGDDADRARARDEGRALAKLSHPNVVPIYDVLEHADGVFLVMELVKGETLRHAARAQTPLQIVRAYRQAGEGLAAAHRAGLIHRDFKPDNAILGADGRVRVLDFGLAHEVAPDGAAEGATIAGTPRYMAPEQRTGAPLTAAVDQYALCVALREALTERGAGATKQRAGTDGAEAPARGAIPRWLAPILARGTAEAPGDRYPSMDALLHALALDPATRRKRGALIGVGAVAAIAVAGAFTLGRAGQAESPCEGGRALLAPSWNPARRAAIAERLAALATPYAAEVAPRVLTRLDDYAAGWIDLHRASCKAHRRDEISSDLLDRRVGCLARRRAALAAVGELATAVASDGLPGLVIAVGELPDLSACDDDHALLSPVPLPAPTQAAEAAAIADAIARIDVERDAGRDADAARDADATLTRAIALAYRPLVARARLARGRVALSAGRDDRGAADFEAAAREALAVGDDPLAIEAYARQVWAAGTTGDPVRATDGLPLVEAITDRAGDRARFARALLHMNVGGVALARGDRGTAHLAFERARAEAVAVGGAGAIELTAVLANLLFVVDDPAQRRATGQALVALRGRLLGARHPDTLSSQLMAASFLDDPAEVRAAMAPACRDLARYHPGRGADVGECGSELTTLALAAGDRAEAAAMADLVIAAAPHGAAPYQVAAARAFRHLTDGEAAAAAAGFAALARELAVDATSPWWAKLAAADNAVAAAMALRAAGDRAAATRHLDDAAALYDQVAASTPPPVLARRRAVIAQLRP